MSWLKLDDQMHRHEKIAPLSDRAWRLHVTALLECCAKLTDGHIARDLPATWPAAPRGKTLSKTIAELEAKGLWEPNDNGWMAHDFLDWNPSAEQVLITRKTRAEAGQKGGRAKAKAKQNAKQNAKQTLEQKPSKTVAKLCPVPVPVPLEDPPIPPGRGATALLDLAGRSRMFLQSKGDAQSIGAQFGEPPTWPEFVATLKAFELRTGARQEIRSSGDSRVSAILQWFSAGFTVSDLEEVFDLAQRDEFWKTKPLAQLLSRTNRLDDLRQAHAAAKAHETKNQIVLSDREASQWS